MKKQYEYPAVCVLFTDTPLMTTSLGSWDESIKDAGSSWGGTDTDDSVYGL